MENTLTMEDLGKRRRKKTWKRRAVYGPLANLGEDEGMEDFGEDEEMESLGDNGTTLTMEDLGRRKKKKWWKKALLPAAAVTAILLARRKAKKKKLMKARKVMPSATPAVATAIVPAETVAGYRIRTFPYGRGMGRFGHRMGIGRKIRTFDATGMGYFGAEETPQTPPAEEPPKGLPKWVIPVGIGAVVLFFIFKKK